MNYKQCVGCDHTVRVGDTPKALKDFMCSECHQVAFEDFVTIGFNQTPQASVYAVEAQQQCDNCNNGPTYWKTIIANRSIIVDGVYQGSMPIKHFIGNCSAPIPKSMGNYTQEPSIILGMNTGRRCDAWEVYKG